MNHFSFILLFIFAFLINISCYKEELVLPEKIKDANDQLLFDKGCVSIDYTNGLALYPVESFGSAFSTTIFFPDFLAFSINNVKIKNGEQYNFGEISASDTFLLDIITNQSQQFRCKLIFTTLPVIEIFHSYEIPDEPKILGLIKISEAQYETFKSFCGIEIRGGVSSGMPKKPYNIELLKEVNGGKRNASLLGMRDDDDWILDAVYMDKSCMRNRVSWEVYSDIKKDSPEYDPGIEGRYVELFINNVYKGIYCFSERMDRKQLNFSRYNGTIETVLYKSVNWSEATKFLGVKDTTGAIGCWDGWEQKYPKPYVISSWKPLYELIDFAANSSDEEFSDGIFTKISKQDAIDFYILLNLISGADNVGKNIFIARGNPNEKFRIIPWDMDASWGRNWDTTKASCKAVITFNLFERIIQNNAENFNSEVKERWSILRSGCLRLETLQSRFLSHTNLLVSSGAHCREKLFWPESFANIDNEMDYINSWTANRLLFLDKYFENLGTTD